MIEIIGGGYTQVELKDGGPGNYEIAQEYFGRLKNLAKKHSREFNELCQEAISGSEFFPSDKAREILVLGGFTYRNSGTPPQLMYPVEEIQDIVTLCAEETRLSKIFGFLGKNPRYDLVSPFKSPDSQDPGIVPPPGRKYVSFDWAGVGDAQYPGHKLRP
jgi:hypothetical protein